MEQPAYDPKDFADADYAVRYEQAFSNYANLRASGISPEMSVMEAFDMVRFGFDLSNVNKLSLACEVNPVVRRKIREALETMDIKRDLWTQKESVFQLLGIAKDPNVRDTTRLNAILALNTMVGYDALPDANTRRNNQTIADFMRLDQEHKAQAWEEASDVVRH